MEKKKRAKQQRKGLKNAELMLIETQPTPRKELSFFQKKE